MGFLFLKLFSVDSNHPQIANFHLSPGFQGIYMTMQHKPDPVHIKITGPGSSSKIFMNS
jgi:hypothetical protein